MDEQQRWAGAAVTQSNDCPTGTNIEVFKAGEVRRHVGRTPARGVALVVAFGRRRHDARALSSDWRRQNRGDESRCRDRDKRIAPACLNAHICPSVIPSMPSCGKRWVKLSPREDELLRALVQHAGKVRTHRFLLKELWDEPTDAQYLRVYVRQLRQKIETDPERPQFVLTEIGIGYRLRSPDQVAAIAG